MFHPAPPHCTPAAGRQPTYVEFDPAGAVRTAGGGPAEPRDPGTLIVILQPDSSVTLAAEGRTGPEVPGAVPAGKG